MTNWQKVPSVSKGGKAWFYVLILPTTNYNVSWDRQEQTYQVKEGGNYQNFLGHFPSFKAGMAFVDALVK